ncbi:MAG: dockerin type I repeat-containing protein [bacterium]
MGIRFGQLAVALVICCTMLSPAAWGALNQVDGPQLEDTPQRLNPPYTTVRVHKVGNVHLAVTNFGMIGTQFAGLYDPETGELAPSCEYSADSDIEYLFQGPLWIGAKVGGDSLVSTGHDGWQHVFEMFASEYPEGDMAKRSTRPTDPAYDPDAISEADYIAVYYDTVTNPSYVAQNPDDGRPHQPLGLQIRQESYSWSDEESEDYVIVRCTFSNIGSNYLDDIYIGIYMDSDVYHFTQTSGFTDDIAGSIIVTEPIWGEELRVGWAADNDGDPSSGSWDYDSPLAVLGIAPLDIPGAVEPNFNWWVSNGVAALDWGPRLAENDQDFGTGGLGTPAGDRNKYYIMATLERDYDQLWAAVDLTSEGWLPPSSTISEDLADGYDTRFLISFGGVDMAPGDSLQFAYVVALGDNFHVGPTDFADLYDPNDPQAYYDALNFGDLLTNVRAAFERYQCVKYVCSECVMSLDTVHAPAAFAIEPIIETLYLGDLAFDYTAAQIDPASITLGSGTVPTSATLLETHPGFTGSVLEVSFDLRSLVAEFGVAWDVSTRPVTVIGELADGREFFAKSELVLIGHRAGDANADGFANITDAIFIIQYIFAGGTEPQPLQTGDPDCSGTVNITDAVYLVQWIFNNGPAPCGGGS